MIAVVRLALRIVFAALLLSEGLPSLTLTQSAAPGIQEMPPAAREEEHRSRSPRPSNSQVGPDAGIHVRACSVFCEGRLLHAVQTSGLFNDSKQFVDMPLRQDPEEVLSAFHLLKNKEDPEVLREFVRTHFEEEGADLVPWTPPDFQVAPPRLSAIQAEDMRTWALALNGLWKLLSRRQAPAVTAHPQRHSAIARRFGMVVPGGRFRETYYWDTLWIVRGLLVSEMVETARGVVSNLLDDVRNFGFVPNGARVYYLDRSQPPVLGEMVLQVYEAAPDEAASTTWLLEALPLLEKEYSFWMDEAHGHVLSLALPSNTGDARLNVYRSSAYSPRPESYKEDVATADLAEIRDGRIRAEVYNQLRSAAESGWDFSTRWLGAGAGDTGARADMLTSVNTSSVVPVDLNCILYRAELNLARIHQILKSNSSAAAAFSEAARQRAKAMRALLWNDELQTFRDLRLDAKYGRHFSSKVVSVSDFALPLWCGLVGPGSNEDIVEATLSSFRRSGLLEAGGASTTLIKSGQQWDAPNAWAPLQLMAIEGLESLGERWGAAAMAKALASSWLHNCFLTWQKTGHMQEKYDAEVPGKSGGGGEYEPQIGFGWSNGVVLVLLARNYSAADHVVTTK